MEPIIGLAPPKGGGIGRLITPSIHDLNLLAEARTKGLLLNFEQFRSNLYLDGLIAKPWGHEYRIYADSFYDVWKLDVFPGQSTSMHCHPRKETALLCLEGTAKFHTLNGAYEIQAMDFVHAQKGTFHSTENNGSSLLKLVEVETPRNKFDLIRAKDKYGRQEQYETQTLDHQLAGIHQSDLLGDAKIRTTGISNKYRFRVKAGMDIICCPNDGLIFVVCLSLKNAIAQNIQIFQPSTMPVSLLEQDKLYFTISHNL